MTVPSTSAQYFHLLRSQALSSPKRPLVVVTPKSMLRAHASRSTFAELESGSFQHVIDDSSIEDPSTVRRIVLCSGKIAHEALAAPGRARARRGVRCGDRAGGAALPLARARS